MTEPITHTPAPWFLEIQPNFIAIKERSKGAVVAYVPYAGAEPNTRDLADAELLRSTPELLLGNLGPYEGAEPNAHELLLRNLAVERENTELRAQLREVSYDLSPPENIDGVAGGPLWKPEE